MALVMQNEVSRLELLSDLRKKQRKAISFNFVTVSDPKAIRDRKTQTTIRSNAGRAGARQRAKKSRPARWTFELTTSSPSTRNPEFMDDLSFAFPASRSETTSDDSAGSEDIVFDPLIAITKDSPLEVSSQTSLEAMNLYKLRPLGVDMSLSPFYDFAVPIDERSRLLFDFFLDYKSRFAYPFMAMCFALGRHDQAIISLILAAASGLYGKRIGRRGRPEHAEAASYLNAGLQIVNSRLRCEINQTSNETVCAVLAIACGEMFEENFDRWDIHMCGLKQIIDARGGLESLSRVHQLRAALFLADMNGGLVLDAGLHFDMSPYLPSLSVDEMLSPGLESLAHRLNAHSDSFPDICDALVSVANLSNYITTHGNSSGFFTNDIIRTERFFPVLYKIMRLTRPDGITYNSSDMWENTRESTRLCLLLYAAFLKQRFQIAPDCTTRRRDGLTRFLSVTPVDESIAPELWLWIYTVLAISDTSQEQKPLVDGPVARICRLMAQMKIRSWCEATQIVRGIAWTDQLQTGGLASVGLEVEEYLNTSSIFNLP